MQPPSPRKLALARGFDRSGLSALLLASNRVLRSPYVRVVNYHDVPTRLADRFEEQLEFFSRHFDPLAPGDFSAFLRGDFVPRRPGIVLTFDDGLKSHAEVAAPLLERHGFAGWFAVPAGFPDLSVEDDDAFRRERHVDYDPGDFEGGPLLSWEDVRKLDGKHVICCHSFSHCRLSSDLSDAQRSQEIRRAKARLEEQLGHPVRAFVWVGGEEWSYSAAAAREIREAGFEHAFMGNYGVTRPGSDPLQIQRSNVEAEYPLELVKLAVSGFFDALYVPKRRRVNRLTAPG